MAFGLHTLLRWRRPASAQICIRCAQGCVIKTLSLQSHAHLTGSLENQLLGDPRPIYGISLHNHVGLV